MMKTEVSSFFTFLLVSTALAGCNNPASNSDLKIVGGKLAEPQPFMAGITEEFRPTGSFCGGAFISDRIVLTAAHCAVEATSKFKISGGISLDSDHGKITLANVKAVRVHPKYDPDSMDNDLALIFLDSLPVGYTPIVPIAINRSFQLPATGTDVTVIGWGNTTSFGSLFDNELRQVDLKTISLNSCKSKYSNVTERQICAGDLAKGGVDSCQGDSGGPLIVKNSAGQKTLVGVVSWGEGCALANKPGVYTRISAFAPWIDGEIAKFTRTNDVTPSAELITDYFTSYCYVPFQGSSSHVLGDAKLVIQDAFSNANSFKIQDPGDSLNNGTVEKICSFEVPGSRKYTASLVEYPQATAPAHLRRIEMVEEATQKRWIAPTSSGRTADLECKFDDDVRSKLTLVNGNSGMLEYEDELFDLTDEVSGSGMGNAKFSCVGPGMTYSYYERQSNAGSTQYFLKVDTTLFDGVGAETRNYFKLIRYAAASTVHVAIATTNGSTGTLTVKNSSTKDLHTWELQCDKPFDLVDSSGRTSNPTLASGFYRHRFMRPSSAIGTIPGGQSVVFEFTATAPLNQPAAAAPMKCMVNRVGVPLTFKSL